MEESKRRQREARQRELAKARKAKSGNDLAALARSAAQRDAEFEELRASALDAVSGDTPTDRTGMTENSRKAYYKEFKKVVDLADVVLEVGCRLCILNLLHSRSPPSALPPPPLPPPRHKRCWTHATRWRAAARTWSARCWRQDRTSAWCWC